MQTDWTKHWDVFNSVSWKFWDWRISHVYKKLLKNVKMKNVKILELGSGSGINSLNLAKTFKADEITLVDFNEKALNISKDVFKDSNVKIRFLKRDVLNLNLKEKFDIVHSEGLVEHFYGKDRIKIFKKHAEFCKKNGLIIIFAPHENFNYYVFKKIYKMANKWTWDEKPVTRDEIKEICDSIKLKIIKEYSSPFFIHEIGVLLKI